MAEVVNTVDPTVTDEFRDSERARMELSRWKRLYLYIFKYKMLLLGITICGIIVGVLEMSFGLITMWLVQDIRTLGQDANLFKWSWLIVATCVFDGIVTGGFVYLVCKVRALASQDIRDDAFVNIQKQAFKFFDARPVGWIMARLTSDCERLSDILAWAFLDLVWGTSMMLSMGVVMLILNWKLALLTFALLPLIAWVTTKFRRSILQSAREVRSENSIITSVYNESIVGVATSKAFVQEKKNLEDFSVHTEKLLNSSVKNLTLSAIYIPTIICVGSVSSGIAIAVGGQEFLNGVIVAGTLLAFMMWMRHFLDPTIELAAWFTEMQTAQASAERIFSVMDAEPAIRDDVNLTETTVTDIDSIRVENMSFAYRADDLVLKDIDFQVKSGETIALVGPTGGGKTSLISVLCRFYEPTTGRILINNQDYRDLPLKWYRSQLGVVLQHPHVFSGTILENIRYGKVTATFDEVVEAARMGGAHEFIEHLEDGYYTNTGTEGSRLSAGQKQLISIARAILADPQILILDEATATIDTNTEQTIQEGLNQLIADRICVIIAHRLSTIKNANKIAFIDRGQIIEYGSHRDLIAKNGRYTSMYRQQGLSETASTSYVIADKTLTQS